MTKTPKDIRSTGRKRLRKMLFDIQRVYKCAMCGRTSINKPPDAPANFEDFWPLEYRVLKYSLDANHINKDLLDVDPVNGEWLCRKCHKNADLKTPKGVSTIENEHGY